MKEGHTLDRLGNLDSSVDEAVKEATKFIGACYGSKSKDDLSEILVEMWSKKMGKKNTTAAPELTRSLADADNRHDAFRGQSRPTNMVPFWVRCDFSLSM